MAFFFMVACGAKVERIQHDGDDDGSTSTVTDPTTTDIATAEADTTTSTTVIDGSSESTTGVTPDPCADEPTDACPPGCVVSEVYEIDDLPSCAATSTARCVSGTFAPDAAEMRSFYRDDAFVLIGTVCGSSVEPGEGWTECRRDDPDNPPGCVCFCEEGSCPGDEDRLAFAACGFEMLCELVDIGPTGPTAGDPQCVLAALRDRTLGAVTTRFNTGFQYEETLAYFDGSDEALIVQATAHDSTTCPGDASRWMDAQRCTLAAPQVFDDCLAEPDPELQSTCLVPSMTWFTSCEPAELSCE